MKLFKIILFIFTFSLPAYSENFIDTEHLSIAENRIALTPNDLKIELDNPNRLTISAEIDELSIGWVRYEDILLLPTARLKISIENLTTKSFIKYKDKIFNFQQLDNQFHTEIVVSLFENHPIQIINDSSVQAKIRVSFQKTLKPNILIDYSCSRNGIRVEGLEDEHFSIGCRTKRIGKFGNEKPLLEVIWLSPNLRLKNSENIPYHGSFLNDHPIKATVENKVSGKSKVISIFAAVPDRLHRLFTAYGFGPYAFDTKIKNPSGDESLKSEPFAPSLMLYLNYKLSETHSIRGFDAAVFKESIFNNAGLYLGSDFGFSFDNKLYFSTLIGVQYLYFKFDKDSKTFNEPIYPQGVEVMYRHAFGIPNYIVSGGVFLSLTETMNYKNIWVRWGNNYFWELNLISWGKDEFSTTTYGLSVGIPFRGFL